MSDEEDYSQFDVQIGNKEYRMIAGRVQECRDEHDKAGEPYEFHTELIPLDGQILFKATVKTLRGEATGHAGAYDKTMIDKTAPFENAETSAVGRALGFLGYGLITGIASAEEVTDAKKRQPTRTTHSPQVINEKQVKLIKGIWFRFAGVDEAEQERMKMLYGVEHFAELTKRQMDQIKEALVVAGRLAFREEIDDDGKKHEVAYTPENAEVM